MERVHPSSSLLEVSDESCSYLECGRNCLEMLLTLMHYISPFNNHFKAYRSIKTTSLISIHSSSVSSSNQINGIGQKQISGNTAWRRIAVGIYFDVLTALVDWEYSGGVAICRQDCGFLCDTGTS